ncbi:MAG TPA: hypothetical protein VLW50_13830 [Streptosporangiaceae bacterium]|nr:hypothetical protein [Streptosporangiaceae bacterium]
MNVADAGDDVTLAEVIAILRAFARVIAANGTSPRRRPESAQHFETDGTGVASDTIGA